MPNGIDFNEIDQDTPKKQEPEHFNIQITMEGGIIQAVSGIPEGSKVTIYDYDTEGADLDEITRIKVRPDDPEDNEYDDCIISTWEGPVKKSVLMK